MRLLSLALPVLLRLGLARATFTLSEVEDQISSYLDQNETIAERSLPQIGCAVAVRNSPGARRLLATTSYADRNHSVASSRSRCQRGSHTLTPQTMSLRSRGTGRSSRR